MKNNLLILLALTAMLSLSAACWQASNEPNQAVVNAENTANQAVVNMNITRGSTLQSSPNATDAPYDLQFLDTMTAHHQSAIEMAKPIAAKSDNAALKAFAAKIIGDQDKEITRMKAWREKWFAGKPPSINMEMPGMMDSLKGINMKKMETANGKLLDLRFLDMMTAHHEGALTMAKEALDKAEHTEIKTLASQIIKAQEAEVEQMQAWKKTLAK